MKTLKPLAIIACTLLNALCFTSCNSPSRSDLTEADKQYILDMTTTVEDNWNEGKRRAIS